MTDDTVSRATVFLEHCLKVGEKELDHWVRSDMAGRLAPEITRPGEDAGCRKALYAASGKARVSRADSKPNWRAKLRAPVFARELEAKAAKINKRAFKEAMGRLFDSNSSEPWT